MLILTCKTKDGKGDFVLLPQTVSEAIERASIMEENGYEPIQLYIGEDDVTKDRDWILMEIEERSKCSI